MPSIRKLWNVTGVKELKVVALGLCRFFRGNSVSCDCRELADDDSFRRSNVFEIYTCDEQVAQMPEFSAGANCTGQMNGRRNQPKE